MERTSDKNSPRIDDAMKGTARGANDVPSTDDLLTGETLGDNITDHVDYPTSGPIHDDAAEARSELARYISPTTFPAAKDDLLTTAESEFAPDRVVDTLRRLPDGQSFENVQQVWSSLGGETETGRA